MIELMDAPHIGRKIQRIRELKGIKQDSLAAKLGISRQAVSKIEQSESVEADKLEQIARALDVSVEAIHAFNENALNHFNSFHDSVKGDFNYYCTFNPVEKLIELFDENKNLYERMLETERSKNKLLEELLATYKQDADRK